MTTRVCITGVHTGRQWNKKSQFSAEDLDLGRFRGVGKAQEAPGDFFDDPWEV